MAEGGDLEWELSKENIQPLRRGRAISALHQALSQQQDGPTSAINQQRQYALSFQLCIKSIKHFYGVQFLYYETRFCDFLFVQGF